ADVDGVGHLVLAAIERDENRIHAFQLAGATRLATLKLIGYAQVVHLLAPRMDPAGAVVLFGGRAMDRPYPGSTMVSTVNGGVTGLVHSLAVELAPIRCNAVHPGIVGDSPYWSAKGEAALEPVRNRTPGGRLVTMEDVVGAVVFLLENRSVNGVNLAVDGGGVLLWGGDAMDGGPRVAVVGAGRMGGAMVGTLCRTGVEVVVFNRTRSKAEEVAEATGATLAATAREAAAQAQVGLSPLADDAAVGAAYPGGDGIVAGLQPGAVVCEASTIDP